MNILGFDIKRASLKADANTSKTTSPGGDVVERPNIDDSVFKAYIPKFLYKPPYGYPRPENIPLIKQMAKNPYMLAVIGMLQEEAAGNKWEIVGRDKDVEITGELEVLQKRIINFLLNPNGNKEGFTHLIKCAVRDLVEVDSGVWVKVFNKKNELTQLFARDGGSFLKNPDIYGYIGDRASIIYPDREMQNANYTNEAAIKYYDLHFKEQAAYFQYGWTTSSMPVPFGKDEIIYMMKNPRSDSIYGISPVQLLTDVILTLVYGSQYNLDFYMNSNMPEGIIQLIGAQRDQIESFKERFESEFRTEDQLTGFMRKIGFKMPVTNVEAKFTPFAIEPAKMQVIEQQKWFSKVVWACFGITADDFGFTEDSNKAVSQTQARRFARKAVRPYLNLIAERINMEIIPEFGTDELTFKWDDYDLEEDIRRHDLYEKQIAMGIKTPDMVAEEENIDIEGLKKSKEENMARQQEMMGSEEDGDQNNPQKDNEKKDAENNDKSKLKAQFGRTYNTKSCTDKKACGKLKQETIIEETDDPDIIEEDDADPFDNTELEADLLSQIKENTAKMKKSLDAYKKGALDDIE